ncbi:MAG: HPF/RaiA family ribosome-associated protein [Burkholderiales bacterium]
MQLPLQITFHGMDYSEAVAEKVRGRAQKLEKYFNGIVSCRVAIERPHHHHGTGNQYRVRVEVGVPGEKLVANREPDPHHAYTDVYVAIRDAFDAVRRQLEDYGRELRGHVKAQEPAPQGFVELTPDEN